MQEKTFLYPINIVFWKDCKALSIAVSNAGYCKSFLMVLISSKQYFESSAFQMYFSHWPACLIIYRMNLHDNVHQSLSEVFSVFLWLLKLSDICLCTILFFNWFELVRLPSFWFSCKTQQLMQATNPNLHNTS